MGKASKRKKESVGNRKEKKSAVGMEALSSPIFTGYSFLITFFLIIIISLLIYSNTFSSPFHFDDTTSIVENYQLRDLKNFWPPSGSRYVGVLSFALNYHFGRLDVFGYHLINIIIHIINSLLVWWLVVLTFRTPVMNRLNANPQLKYFIALVASLIFISHPIQTQAVTYIVQRFASLAALFYVLSLALYIKARLAHQNTEVRSRKSEERQKGFNLSIKSFIFYLLSLVSAVLAMKTKEISFTLPFVVILYEFMFFKPLPLIASGAKQSQGQHFAKRLIYLIPITLTAFIIPLSIIGTDKPIGDLIGELREAAQETESISRGVYLLTQFRVIVTYIRLLFLPIKQNLDYDYPLSHSFFEPTTFLSFLFLLSIFGFAVYLFMRSRRTDNAYGHFISFGIFWFFVTLSVESSIIPIKDVIFEHRLYLPSIGIIITFSSALFHGIGYAREKLNVKISLTLAVCVLLLITAVPLDIVTYRRNLVWKAGIMLWEDVAKKSPNKWRGHNNLGLSYYEKGLLDKAIYEYTTALRLKPDSAEARTNLGVIYYNQNRMDEAIKEYLIALKADYPMTHYNLGLAYEKLGRLDETIEEYKKALRLKPDYAKAHNNLGVVYDKQGRIAEAIREYTVALRLRPDFAETHYNLGTAYGKTKMLGPAIQEFITALHFKPNYPEAYHDLGNAYFMQGQIDAAIREYTLALRLKPNFAEAHYNLGLAYKEKGFNEQALRQFQEALKIRPNYERAQKALESIAK